MSIIPRDRVGQSSLFPSSNKLWQSELLPETGTPAGRFLNWRQHISLFRTGETTLQSGGRRLTPQPFRTSGEALEKY